MSVKSCHTTYLIAWTVATIKCWSPAVIFGVPGPSPDAQWPVMPRKIWHTNAHYYVNIFRCACAFVCIHVVGPLPKNVYMIFQFLP